MNNELILYQSDDGKTQLRLRAEEGSVWLCRPNDFAGIRRIIAGASGAFYR
jgi:hypothetical protein